MDFARQRASSPTYGCNFIIFWVIQASRWADRIGSHVSEFAICYTWRLSGIHMKLSKLRCCRSAMVTVPVMAVALGSASCAQRPSCSDGGAILFGHVGCEATDHFKSSLSRKPQIVSSWWVLHHGGLCN